MIETPENYISGIIVDIDFDACNVDCIVCGLYLKIKLPSGQILTALGGHRWTKDRKLKKENLADFVGKKISCFLSILSQTGGVRESEIKQKQFSQRGIYSTVIGKVQEIKKFKSVEIDEMIEILHVDCGFPLNISVGKNARIIEKWDFIEEEGILNFENLKVY